MIYETDIFRFFSVVLLNAKINRNRWNVLNFLLRFYIPKYDKTN
jgi:hypothetical protein